MGEPLPPPPPMHHGHVLDEPLVGILEPPPRRRPSRRRAPYFREIPHGHFVDDFGRMDLNGPIFMEEKKEEKKEEKFPEPAEKPGTFVAYECYRFAKLETWERAGRQRLNVPTSEIESKIKKSKAQGSILDQMVRMSNYRAEQINRLLDDKNAATKDPHFEWVCASINPKKVSTKKGTYDVPSMDVIVVKMVKKGPSPPSKKDSKPTVPGELIDLGKKPEKEKKDGDKDKDKDKPKSPHFHDPFFGPADGFEGHHAHADPGFIKLGPTGGHEGIQVMPETHHHGEQIPPHAPMAPPPSRRRSMSRPRPSSMAIPLGDPLFDHGILQNPHHSSIDDDISVFFDDDGRSSRTSHSIDFEKHIPRRGSLRPERRRSYREHHRHNSYSTTPRYHAYGEWPRSAGDFAEVIPERHYSRHRHHSQARPELSRSRTLGYTPVRPEITYPHHDTLSRRSYSPTGGGDLARDRLDREIEDLQREMDLRDREERIERKERDWDRQTERRKLDLLDRLTRRSTGRDGMGYRL